MLVAVLHFIMDRDDPYGIVRTLVDALPSGSYVAITQRDHRLHAGAHQGRGRDSRRRPRGTATSSSGRGSEFARFFDGLELVEPGIVSVSEWRADQEPAPRPSAADVSVFGGVARKPWSARQALARREVRRICSRIRVVWVGGFASMHSRSIASA